MATHSYGPGSQPNLARRSGNHVTARLWAALIALALLAILAVIALV